MSPSITGKGTGLFNVSPFKIRKGTGLSCAEIAKEIFGLPSWLSQSISFPETMTLRWNFYEDGPMEVELSISFFADGESMDISRSFRTLGEDHTLCGIHKPGKSEERLRLFIETVKKPWRDWSDEEIMEKPMWVCLYAQDGQKPTPAMDAMMHMISFSEPENPWVRMYFEGRAA